MLEGYVWLWRKSLESAVWQDEHLWRIFTYCLLRANHRETQVIFGGREYVLQPGEFITGRFKLAEDLGWRAGTAWGRLLRLKKLGILDTRSDNRNTVVTLRKWSTYQYNEKPPTPNPTPAQHLADTQPTPTRQSANTDKNERMREGKKTTPLKKAEDNNLVEIYRAYPKHTGRKAALPKIRGAISEIAKERGKAPEEARLWLLSTVRAYAEAVRGWSAEHRGPGDKFIPAPAVWFNQGRYDDDPSTWSRDDGQLSGDGKNWTGR